MIFCVVILIASFTCPLIFSDELSVEDRGQPRMTSKVYPLKHVKAGDLEPFVDGVVKRSDKSAGAKAISRQGKEALLISMPSYLVPNIDKLVESLDRKPTTGKIKNGVAGTGITRFVYQPRYRSTKNMAIVSQALAGGDGGTRVFQDQQTNMIYGKGSKSAIIGTMTEADVQDTAPEETVVITTNNDPNIISKTYVLKHADPYEMKNILTPIVQAVRISGSPTGVEAIKYKDGTGAVIVSAEDYRFTKKNGVGMSIDELVASLDKPEVKANTADSVRIYFPRYGDARRTRRVIERIGFDGTRSPDEGAIVDKGLNAVIVNSAPYRVKHIDAVVDATDIPRRECVVLLSVFKFTSEQTNVFGADYEKWSKKNLNLSAKNGQGTIYFAGVNIKISSAYLDFLIARDRLRKMVCTTIRAENGETVEFDSMRPVPPPSGSSSRIITGREYGLKGSLKVILPEDSAKGECSFVINLKYIDFIGYNKYRRMKFNSFQLASSGSSSIGRPVIIGDARRNENNSKKTLTDIQKVIVDSRVFAIIEVLR